MKPLFTTLIATAMATGAMIASTNAATFSMTTSGFSANGTGGGTSAGNDFQEYTVDGIVMTVSAGMFTDTNNVGSAVVTPGARDAEPRVYSNGTGLDHDGGNGLPNDGDHRVDGRNGNEVLILSFDTAVQLASAMFTYVENNDDFDLFMDSDGDGILERIARRRDIPGGGLADLVGLNLVSNLFGIGASGSNDEWKLRSVSVMEVSDIPLPAAFPLFLAGMAGFGFASRKKTVR